MLIPDLSAAQWRKSSRSSGQGGQCVEVASVSAWRKSSRSSAQGGNCVEVAGVLAWRKSSRSSGQGGACVEVASLTAVVAVRDSKNPDGPALAFSRSAFGTLMAAVKTGRYDL